MSQIQPFDCIVKYSRNMLVLWVMAGMSDWGGVLVFTGMAAGAPSDWWEAKFNLSLIITQPNAGNLCLFS